MKLSVEVPTGEPYVPMVYDITPNQWVYQIEDLVFTIWGEERSDGYMVTGVYSVEVTDPFSPAEMQFLFGEEEHFLWDDQSEAIHEVAGALVEWVQKRDGVEPVPSTTTIA